MELSQEFTVKVPVDEAWSVLTDVERIAPCMPGAQLQEVEGDEYRGVVKVKVGPISAQYKGKASFVEQNPASGRAVLRAEGRETRGQGNASATITAVLEPVGDGTRVTVTTDLTVSGKVAQFGRGVLAEVSDKLLGQFVDCLESKVLAGTAGVAAEPAGKAEESLPDPAEVERPGDARAGDQQGSGAPVPTASQPTAPATAEPQEADDGSVDLLRVVGPSVAKRVLPVLVAALVGLWLVRRRRRAG